MEEIIQNLKEVTSNLEKILGMKVEGLREVIQQLENYKAKE